MRKYLPVKSRLCYQYFRPTDPSDPPVKYTELIGERDGVLVLARVCSEVVRGSGGRGDGSGGKS